MMEAPSIWKRAIETHRLSISIVTKPSSFLWLYRSKLYTIKPKKNPTVVASNTPNNSLAEPNRMSDRSSMTMPNMVAIIGPINGDMSILDTSNIILFSTKPNAANELQIIPFFIESINQKEKERNVYLATMISVTKSNVSVASSLTAWTICATFRRARIDDRNRSHAVCFWAKIHL